MENLQEHFDSETFGVTGGAGGNAFGCMQTGETLFGTEPVAPASEAEGRKQRKLTAASGNGQPRSSRSSGRSRGGWRWRWSRLIGLDHPARAIWELTGKLDLGKFYEPVVSAQGLAGRRGWDPRLLLSIWLYAYSKGESSSRAVAREMEYEPGLMWLGGWAR